MQNAANLPMHVPTLHHMLIEQQHMIDHLQEQLRLALRRQFGPRNEYVNVDQLGLFAGDNSTIIEIAIAEAEDTSNGDDNESSDDSEEAPVPKQRRQAIRTRADLPREIRFIDIPDEEKVCSCCGGELHHFGDDCSEQLDYVPATVRIIETRRKKYACNHCHGDIKRAKLDVLPLIPKGMVTASFIAFLIVSKYADHQPLYRLSQGLNRLGIAIAHTLMSQWLIDVSELLEDVHARMIEQVLVCGHLFTDDTILPLQNKDPTRHTTQKARLWTYAAYTQAQRQRPLAVYDFSATRSQSGPQKILADFQGFIQADAYPGYDALYRDGTRTEVACWEHARRKFVEVATLSKTPQRAHIAIGFIKKLYAVERQIKTESDDVRRAQRQLHSKQVLAEFKAWLDAQVHAVLPKSALGTAIFYTVKNWEALCRYNEHGFLEADNNFAERCMRPVALGRKNYLFVGSERGGKAAAIYYSLIESCKLNGLNPLMYMTYVLSNVRNKSIALALPHEFSAQTHPTSHIG